MFLANIMSGGLLLVMGILIRVFNLSFLIAGYNTASKEQKARYNEKELTRFVGSMLCTSGAVLLAGGFMLMLKFAAIEVFAVSWGLFLVIIIVGLIYVNTSPRFKNKDKH